MERGLAGTALGPAEHALLLRFPALRGGRELLDRARAGPRRAEGPLRALDELARLWELLRERRLEERVHLDLGAVRDWNYYTGPTFELFSGDVGFPLGAGGRYDSPARALRLAQPATGFVVHADRCHDAISRRRDVAAPRDGSGLRIAVPTGALLADACALLRESGVAPELRPESFERRLQLEVGAPRGDHRPAHRRPRVRRDGRVRLRHRRQGRALGVEPRAVRDRRPAASARCRLVLAAPEGSALAGGSWPAALRVATKYPQAARRFFAGRGGGAELIRLHGSVELAPSAGLSDGIVDLVATGATLRANRLCEVATIATSTARLVVNVASMKTRSAAITELATTLRAHRGGGAAVTAHPRC